MNSASQLAEDSDPSFHTFPIHVAITL